MLKRGLIQFVPPNFSADATALVIDEEKYLPPLRELMPDAKFEFITSESKLPTGSKMFDVIIAENCLSYSIDTYILLMELNQLLKDTGFLLTKFFNVRFTGVLESLRQGKFPTQEKKFWAKYDVVKILEGANYKEIHFLPEGKVTADVDEWLNFGFENFSDDLLTKIWLVKACKSTAEVAALKELYTSDIRAELSRLIHRVEYGIDVDENVSRLKNLCRRENIFADYFNDFVAQVTVHEDIKNFLIESYEV